MDVRKVREALQQYGELYKSRFSDGYVLWRPLTKEENEQLIRLTEYEILDPIDQEDYVYDTCLVLSSYPEEEGGIRAGIIATVAQQILHFTSYTPDRERFLSVLNENRYEVNGNPIWMSMSIITKTFPAYKVEDLNKMTLNQLMKLCAMAEQVSEYSLEISDPRNDRNKLAAPLAPGMQTNVAGGMESELHRQALDELGMRKKFNTPEMRQWLGQEEIPLITEYDLHTPQSYVDTDAEAHAMVLAGMPLVEEYRRDVLGWYF